MSTPPRQKFGVESARHDLCARLFADASVLANTLTHDVRGTLNFQPHVHEDLLQLDLLVGCGGRAFINGAWSDIAGITALASCPGHLHGYELRRPSNRPARVYHLKLRCEKDSPAIDGSAFPGFVTGMARADALIGALRLVVQLGLVRQMRSPALLPRLCEALCLWPYPASREPAPPQPAMTADDLPAGLAATVALIDSRLEMPPSLEELAEVASLSPRHFARQFKAHFGCTAHTYATARRLAAARQMLLEPNERINRVADRLGFPDLAIFSRWFRQHAGVSPREFRSSPTTM
jgi:AraC family transcriptional regulator